MRIETSRRMNIGRKIFLTLLCAACAAVSCRQARGIIPEDELAAIYYDMYMTDEAVKANSRFRRMTDTLLIYEPIFKRHGYTSQDYTRSVNYYLEHTEQFQKIFEQTRLMMDMREAELNAVIDAENKILRRWSIIDSLEILTADGVQSPLYYKFMRILFFEPDTVLNMSPMPDSTVFGRPQNPFMIFNDSALNADSRFEFYLTDGFMNKLDSADADSSAVRQKPAGQLRKPLPLNARPQTIQLDTI